jgi:hypothetical protein
MCSAESASYWSHVVVEELDVDLLAADVLQHPSELVGGVLAVVSFPRRLGQELILDRLKDGLASFERPPVPVPSDVRRIEEEGSTRSDRTVERLEEVPGRVRNVLDDCAGYHDVEPAERRDLFELALTVGRNDADPLGSHQLDVAVKRIAVARVAVARDDVVAEPAKGEGEGPKPGAHLEHLPALEASTPQQFHEPHHSDDVHAKVGAHRALRQHSHVLLERIGLESLEQLDQVLRGIKHDGVHCSAPKRARVRQPQRCRRTVHPEWDAGRADRGDQVLGPGPHCAAGPRRDRVAQRERYVLVGELDRSDPAGEHSQEVTLGRSVAAPVSDHKPSSRLAVAIDQGADKARLTVQDHPLRRDVRRPILGEDSHTDFPTPTRYEGKHSACRLSRAKPKPDGVLPGSCPGNDPGTPVPQGLKGGTLADGRRVEGEPLDWCASGGARIA